MSKQSSVYEVNIGTPLKRKHGCWVIGVRSGRGIFAGGEPSNNIIEYINISTLGNVIDFGDLLGNCTSSRGVSSVTRGIYVREIVLSNPLEYVTIATTGNATDFGDQLVGTIS